MNAAVAHVLGELPRYDSFPEPVAGEGEDLLEVISAGLHPLVKALVKGTHYGTSHELPFVPGVDGVGRLPDGSRVYFSFPRAPFGSMAQRTVVARSKCVPVPDGLDDHQVAAAVNPGMSAWLALTWRGQLAPGETVLILGATGTAGQLAVQLARQLGAGWIIAAGRDAARLESLRALGADALVSLGGTAEQITEAILEAAGGRSLHVIVDYLWGMPTEATLAAIARRGLTTSVPRVRLVQVGQSAGATIALPASLLRGSGLEITGTGFGTLSPEKILEALPAFLGMLARGHVHLSVETLPLAEVQTAWQREGDGRRVVLVP